MTSAPSLDARFSEFQATIQKAGGNLYGVLPFASKAPAAWPLERVPYYLETAVPGSFAAGDVRHRSIKRVAAAAGEGT